MQILECPYCKKTMLKIYTLGDSSKIEVDFSISNALETAKCRNCNKEVKYSLKRVKKGEKNGRDSEN
jgi:Zn finger protein HypA/HybF involved in hydrogenase expression